MAANFPGAVAGIAAGGNPGAGGAGQQQGAGGAQAQQQGGAAVPVAGAGLWPDLQGTTLRELYAVISPEPNDGRTIAWLRANGLLARDMNCPQCRVPMREGFLRGTIEGQKWRCPNKPCRKQMNVRVGSWFERSHLRLEAIMEILYMWSEGISQEIMKRQIPHSSESAIVQWTSFIRDVCSADLIANRRLLGGPGHTIAVDETLIAKRKPGNAQGRPVPQQWMIGGVDINTKEFFFLMINGQRNAANLLAAIRANILPGTTIWTDEWAGYRSLNRNGYAHQTVNHSHHFVDPVTGVHTNDIEGRWNTCKAFLKTKFGVRRLHLPAYLDEFMWRAKRQREDIFNDIVAAIRRQYPV